jgi:hypothetical protein
MFLKAELTFWRKNSGEFFKLILNNESKSNEDERKVFQAGGEQLEKNLKLKNEIQPDNSQVFRCSDLYHIEPSLEVLNGKIKFCICKKLSI